jgi:hypothetical protein
MVKSNGASELAMTERYDLRCREHAPGKSKYRRRRAEETMRKGSENGQLRVRLEA